MNPVARHGRKNMKGARDGSPQQFRVLDQSQNHQAMQENAGDIGKKNPTRKPAIPFL
jgi:hypothetical protein